MKNGFSLLDLGANYHAKSILVEGGGDEIIKVPFIGVVFKIDKFIALFDTGPNIEEYYPIMKTFSTEQKEEQHLDKQLKLLDINVNEINMVIISHLHFDHAGGLKYFRSTNIPILVQKSELDYAYNPDWFYKSVYFKNDFDFDDLNFIKIYGDYKINDNLELYTLYGHTPGTQGLIYKTEKNKIIFTSDAIYTLENIEPTLKRQGFDACTSEWGKSANKVILKHKFDNFDIYPGHDPKFYSNKKFAPYVYF